MQHNNEKNWRVGKKNLKAPLCSRVWRTWRHPLATARSHIMSGRRPWGPPSSDRQGIVGVRQERCLGWVEQQTPASVRHKEKVSASKSVGCSAFGRGPGRHREAHPIRAALCWELRVLEGKRRIKISALSTVYTSHPPTLCRALFRWTCVYPRIDSNNNIRVVFISVCVPVSQKIKECFCLVFGQQVCQTWCQMESSCGRAVVHPTMQLLRSSQEGVCGQFKCNGRTCSVRSSKHPDMMSFLLRH